MGTFLVNVHVRTDDHEQVAHEVRSLPIDGCWVTSPANGWTSIFEERASSQDDRWIRDLAAGVSRKLGAPSIAFLVHDSDIFCYWLFDRGELLDEFNSCPDYFGDDTGDPEEVAGQPQVLLPFCRPGTRPLDLERVLSQRQTFAEEQVVALAELLGIDMERVMTDFRHLGDERDPDEIGAVSLSAQVPRRSTAEGPRILRLVRDDEEKVEQDETGDTGDDDAVYGNEDDDGPVAGDDDDGLPASAGAASGLAQFLGLSSGVEPADPMVSDLVQAASEGNIAEIERLAAAGAALNGRAPIKRPPTTPASPAAKLVRGGLPPLVPLSPLHAAVAARQTAAARRLIELGADVSEKHPLFGTLIHVAAMAGAPDLVELLLDAGAAPNERNVMQQTPLASLRAMRQMVGQWGSVRGPGALMLDKFREQINALLPAWEECERILLDRGGE